MPEILEKLDDKFIYEILPELIKKIRDLNPQIIMAALCQVIGISGFLNSKGEKGYKVLVETLLPFMGDLVRHNDPDTKELARVKLGEIAPILTENDRGYHILPICLE